MAKENNPLLFRYPPNNRFINGGFKNQSIVNVRIETFGDSVTDKESYRLSMASKRGSLANLSGGANQSGYYMFPSGEYDPMNDFSYIYRKDISIVEIDNYIENMKNARLEADEQLKKHIDEQLSKAEEAKKQAEIALQTSKESSTKE